MKKKKKKFLLLLKTSRIIKLRLVKRERERDREVQNTIELSVYTRIIILFKMDWKSPKLNWVSQKLLGSFFFFFCFLFLSHLSLEKLLVFPIFPFCRKGGGERPNLIITNQWNSFKLKSHSSQFESKRKRKRKKNSIQFNSIPQVYQLVDLIAKKQKIKYYCFILQVPGFHQEQS